MICPALSSKHVILQFLASNTVLLFLAFLSLPTLVEAQTLNEQSSIASPATTTDSAPTEAETTPNQSRWFKTENINLNGRTFNDFVVAPGKVELNIPPGESRQVMLTVTNRFTDDRQFNVEVEDFTSSTNLDSPVQLLGDTIGPRTLQDYISIPGDSFVIDLGERALIPVTISIPHDAEPGGRYGSVLISTVDRNAERGSLSSSPLVARIGTLFFVTIPGDVERTGELQKFSTINDQKWYESGPIEFGIVYENTGNVHLNPYGELEITNMLGESVGFVELDPWFVLPESLRLKEVAWDREALFGRYAATVRLNRGYDDIIDEQTIHFWVLPWKIVAGIFVFIFLVVFVARFFLKNFELKRKP